MTTIRKTMRRGPAAEKARNRHMTLCPMTSSNSPQRGESLTCEACGRQFTCGATQTACWCAEIKLSETARAALRESYQQCLCRTCLENAAGEDGQTQVR